MKYQSGSAVAKSVNGMKVWNQSDPGMQQRKLMNVSLPGRFGSEGAGRWSTPDAPDCYCQHPLMTWSTLEEPKDRGVRLLQIPGPESLILGGQWRAAWKGCRGARVFVIRTRFDRTFVCPRAVAKDGTGWAHHQTGRHKHKGKKSYKDRNM